MSLVLLIFSMSCFCLCCFLMFFRSSFVFSFIATVVYILTNMFIYILIYNFFVV